MLGFGTYAGDRLNFGVAAERLINEGIDTRIVYITDDVASASPEEQQKRRGIAGTFTVYKIAAAAAEDGANLDEVERVMRAANAATYSFGVAFHGCTLPGAARSRCLPSMRDTWTSGWASTVSLESARLRG